MLRYLGLAIVVVTLGLWARAAVQGQDDKKEPEIILKKKDRKDGPKTAVDDPKGKEPKKEKENEKDKEKPKRELPKIDNLPDEPEGAGEDPAKIVERIKKNLSTTDERLDKKDPGDETRKLQDKIVKDLDELIKQQQDQDNNQSSKSSQSQQKASSSKSSKSSSGKKSSSDPKSASGKKENKQPKGSNGEKPEPMGSGKDPKDPKGGQSAGKGQDSKKKTGKNNGNGGKGGDSSAKNKSTVADLYPDIWGHLPQTKRLEMDAYSRERFMPRYEELLRQYYRTIAEQGRRKEGD